MPETNSDSITRLLTNWGNGDPDALEQLVPRIYDHLLRLARRQIRAEQVDHTLDTRALVHEAYLELIQVNGIDWRGRAQFYAVSAQIMRRILIDAARSRAALKRGGPMPKQACSVDVDQLPIAAKDRSVEVLALDGALRRLALLDARKAQVIELRFFGGLSVDETAEVLQVSAQTVMRDWKLARVWLMQAMGTQAG